MLTVLITIGIKESLRVNLVLVGIKLFIVLFVIIAGLFYINPANYSPFIPPAQGGGEAASSWLTQPLIQFAFGLEPTAYGVGGIFAGAALVFFAYIGFDVVATTAEEAKNPQRDLPIGIIASLIICTILYCAVALVITGMVKYDQIDPKAALATAFTSRRQTWIRDPDRRRGGGRSHHRRAHPDDRGQPGAVRHVAGPPDAAGAVQGAPEVPDAVRDHHRDRHPRRR